jgi:hypothetical protein
MPTLNDLVSIFHKSTLNGNEADNSFTYRVTSITGTPDLAQVCRDQHSVLWTHLQNYQFAGLAYTENRWLNLTNTLEFHNEPLGGTGAASGDILSYQDALALRLNRTTRVTRNGQKRYGFITDAFAVGGAWTFTGTQIAQLEADNMADVASSGSGWSITLRPVIVGRNSTGGFDLSRVNSIQSVTLNPIVSSQNTRKFGRGV